VNFVTKLLGGLVQQAWAERSVDAKTLHLRAEKGDARAQYAMGERCYDQLLEEDAAAWFEMAAQQGYARAQHNLGMMYILGRGVRKNLVEAYKWLTIAEGQGHEKSKAVRARIWKKLTPEQLEMGQLSAARFTPKPVVIAANQVDPPEHPAPEK
jgi:TPR repeat protein